MCEPADGESTNFDENDELGPNNPVMPQKKLPSTAIAPPVERMVSYMDALGNKQTVSESAYGTTAGLNPLSAGSSWASIVANPDQAKNYRQMGQSGEMLYDSDERPDRPTNESFVGGTITTSRRGMMDSSRRGSLQSGSPLDAPEGSLSKSGQVQLQQGEEGSYGGEVGVGSQGFGARSLQAGEGDVQQTLGPAGTPEQSGTPADVANSDLQQDPTMPVVTPTSSVVPDVNYIVPTSERSEQMIAFDPNDPNSAYVARGPVSSSLRSRRAGWGSNIFQV